MAVVTTFDTPADKGHSWSMPNYVARGVVALGTYTTNGVAVTKATFGLNSSLDSLDLRSTSGYVPDWGKGTGLIRVFQQSAATGPLTEVPNNTDLSAVSFRFVATGK